MTVADTRDVRIDTVHGELTAALATPDNDAEPAPGVIVLHELFGLNNDIRRITRRFAEHGYVALAPNLYSVGPWLRPLCIMQTMNQLRAGEGRSFDVIESARAWLASRDDVDATRLAAAGFCLGGGFAMLYAARAPLGAAAVFYGRAPRNANRLDGICPVYGAFGERDTIAAGQADRLRGHLEQLGVEHEITVFPDAGHSFMSQYDGIQGFFVERSRRTIGYHAESADRAWPEMLEFFAQHLGQVPSEESGTSHEADA